MFPLRSTITVWLSTATKMTPPPPLCPKPPGIDYRLPVVPKIDFFFLIKKGVTVYLLEYLSAMLPVSNVNDVSVGRLLLPAHSPGLSFLLEGASNRAKETAKPINGAARLHHQAKTCAYSDTPLKYAHHSETQHTATRPCILLQMISCHLKDNKQAAIDRWRRPVIFGTLLLNIKENQWPLHRGMERKEWSSVSGLFELIFLSLWLPTSRSPQPPFRLLHSPPHSRSDSLTH